MHENFIVREIVQNDDFGSIPKAGPYNLSGTWGGAFGNVIYKDHDLSMNTWVWNIERTTLVQFVPIAKDVNILVWTPHHPYTDFGLFTRNINQSVATTIVKMIKTKIIIDFTLTWQNSIVH